MSAFRFEYDRAGFLMVWIDEIQAYVHWLPISKIEYEIFMCDPTNNKFDDRWYKDILDLNERVAVKKATTNNYWNLFLTGIRPDEISDFTNWLSAEGERNYSLPTFDEWMAIYNATKDHEALEDLAPYVNSMPERIKGLHVRVNEILRPLFQKAQRRFTLADQMLLREGTMEWVEVKEQQWGGLGKPAGQFQPSMRHPDSGIAEMPRSPEKNRFHYYGFRLTRK